MKKEYTKCYNGLTSNCPYIGEECMKNLQVSTQSTDKIFNDNDINSANALCQNCDKFTPFKNQNLKD